MNKVSPSSEKAFASSSEPKNKPNNPTEQITSDIQAPPPPLKAPTLKRKGVLDGLKAYFLRHWQKNAQPSADKDSTHVSNHESKPIDVIDTLLQQVKNKGFHSTLEDSKISKCDKTKVINKLLKHIKFEKLNGVQTIAFKNILENGDIELIYLTTIFDKGKVSADHYLISTVRKQSNSMSGAKLDDGKIKIAAKPKDSTQDKFDHMILDGTRKVPTLEFDYYDDDTKLKLNAINVAHDFNRFNNFKLNASIQIEYKHGYEKLFLKNVDENKTEQLPQTWFDGAAINMDADLKEAFKKVFQKPTINNPVKKINKQTILTVVGGIATGLGVLFGIAGLIAFFGGFPFFQVLEAIIAVIVAFIVLIAMAGGGGTGCHAF